MTSKEIILKGISKYYEGELVEFHTSNKDVVFIYDIKNCSLGVYLDMYAKNNNCYDVLNLRRAISLSDVLKILENEL